MYSDNIADSNFDQVLGEAIHLISNPKQMWQIGDLERKRMIQKMVFPNRVSYVWNDNFRKPQEALPFRAFQGLTTEKSGLVEATGVSMPSHKP